MTRPIYPLIATSFLLSLVLSPWSYSDDHAATAPATSHAAAHGTLGVAPDQMLSDLKAGNQRFIDDQSQHTHQNSVRRKELIHGQKPGAIVLSCSDSRVPPEVIFDQGLGDIFTIRVAGNILGAATVASIEYAVEHLGTRLIVVMGHESCGAVSAALKTPVGKTAGSPDLDSLISTIQGNLTPDGSGDGATRALASATTDKTLRQPVMRNVDAVVKSLKQRSRIVSHAIEEGKVQVVPAIYGLESGKVDFF